MAEAVFSSQSSADVLSGNSCDMKEIIAMWDPRPGDNSLGPDFRRPPPQEVASLEQKFECAQDTLSQRTSSLGKRDFSALLGGEGSRHSLELNGGASKMLRLDSSKDPLGKRDVAGGESTRHGFERNGPPGVMKSGETSREGAPGGGATGPTSFAGLFMHPPLLPTSLPHGFRPLPGLIPLAPFPQGLPPPLNHPLPSTFPPHPQFVPYPPLVPPIPSPIKPEHSGSLDSERSSDGPCVSADPSVHGGSGFRRVDSKGAGGFARGSGSVEKGGGDKGLEAGGDADPQKTQREKNMLKSRRHRLRKKAQETLLREKIGKLEAELAGVRSELNRVATEGRKVIERLQEDNNRLRAELNQRAFAPLGEVRPLSVKGGGAEKGAVNQAEEIEKLQAENRTLKEGYRNVLATMNELMQTKAS